MNRNWVDKVYEWVFKGFRRLLSHEQIGSNIELKRFLGDKHALYGEKKAHEDEAMRYGFRYRGGFIVVFMLGLMAVACALLPLVNPHHGSDTNISQHAATAEEHHQDPAHLAIGMEKSKPWVSDELAGLLTIAEIVFILLILLQHLYGREPEKHDQDRLSKILRCIGIFKNINQGWRSRWAEERLLAEQYRYAELLLAFPGGALNVQQVLLPEAEKATLFLTKYQGWAEDTHPSDAIYVNEYREHFEAVLQGQIEYHQLNATRYHGIAHRLHHWADICFWLTLVFCLTHLFLHSPLLNVLTAFLPAAGATCHGILAAGEFEKIGEQSHEMHKNLEAIHQELKAPTESELEVMKAQVLQFYRLVIDEAAGWHFVLRGKELLPA